MTCTTKFGCSASNNCPTEDGCIPGVCPDFVIRRHDTKPSFRVKMEDCDGPMDLTDLVLEASMWAKGKLKKNLTISDTYFSLADNIGFNQIMIGDIILIDNIRSPEKMLVTAFDEKNKFVQVQRGYHGTTIQEWKKGTSLKIIKFIGAVAETEMLYEDILEIDGTTTLNVLTNSFFVYNWAATDTCLPGCYYFEFKLLKMLEEEVNILSDPITPSVIPSFSDPNIDYGCGLGEGVEWVRRFPLEEGFVIKIVDSFTSENF